MIDELEELFGVYKSVLGSDYDKYRNHVYRVFLACMELDASQEKEEQYIYAAFFHDIGIWTADTIDYLDPSIAEACKYLAEHEKGALVGEVTLMIYWHHKIRKYQGLYSDTVEVFRKADWIDVSFGVIRFGVPGRRLRLWKKIYPYRGFHRFLIGRVLKNILRHPFNPLPMFKQ